MTPTGSLTPSKLKLCPEQLSHFLRRLSSNRKEEERIKEKMAYAEGIHPSLSSPNLIHNNNGSFKIENRRPFPTYKSSSIIPSSTVNLKEVEKALDESGIMYCNGGGLNGSNLNNLNGDSQDGSNGGGFDSESRDRLNSFPRIDPTSIPRVLRRNSSFNDCFLDRSERRVLVIYTGGTIGMTRSSGGGNFHLNFGLTST